MKFKNGIALWHVMAVSDVLIPGLPRDAFSEETTRIPRFYYSTGGDAMNEAVALVKLGHRAKLYSLVRADLFGDYVLKSGRDAGVDMLGVARDSDLPTTVSLVCIHPDGERSFIVNEGADNAICETCFDMDALKAADVMSVGSAFCAQSLTGSIAGLLKAAKDAGVTTCVDVMRGPDPDAKSAARKFLPYTDFVFPNYDEGCWLTDETELDRIGASLLSMGAGHAVVKTGRDGCHVFAQNGEHTHVLGFQIDDVKDTTGAGDHFAAGFIAALMEGKSPVECARFANAVAACSIRYVGTTGLAGREEVEALLQSDYVAGKE